MPTTRDRLIPALRDGLGDVAVANLTVTDERWELVDFTTPVGRNVAEVVVGHSAAAEPQALSDLSGKRVFVRPGSSYARHLEELNADFATRGLAPVEVVDAPAQFEDEDVLEMFNAGLVEYTVVDNYIAQQWKRVLADIRVHDDVVVRGGNGIAFAIRKNSPLLKNELDTFLAGTRRGTAFGNIVYRRYFESTRFVTNATARSELEKPQQLATRFRRYGASTASTGC